MRTQISGPVVAAESQMLPTLPSALLVLTALLVGCGVVTNPASPQRLDAWNHKQAQSDYRIGRGDELDVVFFYAPELTTKAFVRPDGKISLPFLGDVKVVDQAPAALAGELKNLYKAHLPRPEISVNIRTFGAYRVFVGGEVTRPGAQPLIGATTAIQAIMTAEGFTERALLKEIVVMRQAEGNRLIFSVNLESAMNGKDPTQDIVLQPSDVLIVPRTGISNVNLWVDQYIRRNIPFGAYVNYSFAGTHSQP
jgi:polysaccharide export outer membrane protein